MVFSPDILYDIHGSKYTCPPNSWLCGKVKDKGCICISRDTYQTVYISLNCEEIAPLVLSYKMAAWL